MKYPVACKNMIDVTNPPYNANNGLIETVDAEALVTGVRFKSDIDAHSFNIIIRECMNGVASEVGAAEVKDVLNARSKRLNRYRSGEIDNFC